MPNKKETTPSNELTTTINTLMEKINGEEKEWLDYQTLP
jgi:hypothetical protein